LVRALLETALADQILRAEIAEDRALLYKNLLRKDIEMPANLDVAPGDNSLDRSRIALLLTTVEEFSGEEAALILGVDEEEVERLVARSIAEIENRSRTSVLIIEDEPLISMQLDGIVSELGHKVIGIAATRDQAVSMASNELPGLVIADIALADGSSGIDAVKDILSVGNVPIIFVTAYPERLLTEERPEPTYLVTKPFQEFTVRNAISQALFARTLSAEEHDRESEISDKDNDDYTSLEAARSSRSAIAIRELASANLRAAPGPLDADVVGGRLTLSQSEQGRATTSLANLEVLRELHAETADQLLSDTLSNSAPPGVRRRVATIRRALTHPFSDASGTSIGVQAIGLRKVVEASREMLLEEQIGDLFIFADDLHDLAWRFPSFQDFRAGAEEVSTLTDEGRSALIQASKVIEEAPDTSVDPAIKQELSAIREDAEEQRDSLADLALIRSLGNIWRSIGRVIQARVDGVKSQAIKTFDEDLGKTLGQIPSYLLKGGALLTAAHYVPGELGVAIAVAGAWTALTKKDKDD
jgi:CheY-like chemotaxis protein